MSKQLDFLYAKVGCEVQQLAPEWHPFPTVFFCVSSISEYGVVLPPHLPKAVQPMLVQPLCSASSSYASKKKLSNCGEKKEKNCKAFSDKKIKQAWLPSLNEVDF